MTTKNLPANRNSTSTSQPPGFDRELDRDVAALRNCAEREGRQMVLMVTPPAGLITRMAQRVGALRGALVRYRDEQKTAVTSAIIQMLGSYRNSGNGRDSPQAIGAKYAEVLGGEPLWAVQQVCKAIEAGNVVEVSKDYPPSTARLLDAVRAVTDPLRIEAAELDALAHAEVRPPVNAEMAERCRVAATSWLDRSDPRARRMVEGSDTDQAERAEHAKKRSAERVAHGNAAILREYDRLGIEPVYTSNGMLVSPALAEYARGVTGDLGDARARKAKEAV